MKRSTLLIFYGVLAISFLALSARLVQMQVIEGGIYQSKADNNRFRVLTTKAPRGVVYDRNLRQLISNQPSFSVAVTEADLPEDPEAQAGVFLTLAGLLNTAPVWTAEPDKLFADPVVAKRVIAQLAQRLNTPVNELTAMLENARKVSPETPALLRSDLDAATAALVVSHAADWPGVTVMNELQFNFITRRDRPYNPVTVKRNIPFETMQRVEEEHLRLPGVSVVPEPVRQYAAGSFMSHILGYVGPIPPDQYKESLPAEGSGDQPPYEKDDKVGLLGIEASMEQALRGSKGVREIEVNVNQREVREIRNQAPTPGQNVVLTVDSTLQMSVTHLLQEGIDAAHAGIRARGVAANGGGVAIVEKVNTGEILAMVSLPSYDDNLFAAGISQEDFDKLNNDPNFPMFHRAIGGGYPPGSTLKMITAAAGLQDGVIDRTSRFNDPGHIDVPLTYDETKRTPYYCWKRVGGHGELNVLQALQQSCDVFFYEVAGPSQTDARGLLTRFYIRGDPNPQLFHGLGITRMNDYMTQFGLGSQTGIELPGEINGVAPDPAYKVRRDPNDFWSLGDTLATSIGQGFNTVTPLQLTNVTAAVANGGWLYQPRIVSQILDSDGGTVVQDFRPKLIRQIGVSQENLATVREGMRISISDPNKGTGYRTELKGVHVAGKTGTAEIGEVIDAAGHRRAHAWFTAFAPYEKPEIAVTVLIEAGDESLEGSTFAVPVARGIFKAYFHLNEP
ncbi:MAG TPA: penicillin-binding protein 2 [Chloroflexia bacterium]|nr:penicillin-binding protein 2 [Chloroflexia bacterium]